MQSEIGLMKMNDNLKFKNAIILPYQYIGAKLF